MKTDRTVTWITDVDEQRMWKEFLGLVDEYQKRKDMKRATK
jgi:hypothetical protein